MPSQGNMDPRYSTEERRADGAIHVLGIFGGLAAVIAMMIPAAQSLKLSAVSSLSIYSVTLLMMLGCSAAYNLRCSTKWSSLLQRFDHAAIFLKIAGTYTPFAVLMGGIAGYLMLSMVWTIALLGAAAKFVSTNWNGIDIPVYLALGWIGLLALEPIATTFSPRVLSLLAAGGVLYSVGVIFHVWRGLKYHNAIWHAFVLVATGCHFGAVAIAAFALSSR